MARGGPGQRPGARAFYSREGWRDAGTFVLPADTADGTIEVPSHRYEIDLAER